MRKLKAIGTILAASLLLAACGGQEEGNKEEGGSSMNKDAVYREEADFLELGEGNVAYVQIVGDTLYLEQVIFDWGEVEPRNEDASAEGTEEGEAAEEGETQEEATEESADAKISAAVSSEMVVEETAVEMDIKGSLRKIIGFDMQGKQKSVIEMEIAANEGSGAFAVDEAGNIYSIFYAYASHEGEDTKDKVYLKAYSKDGTEQWSVNLNEKISEDEYYYVNGIFVTDKNQIVLDGSRGVEIYDNQGNPVKMHEKPEETDCNLKRIREGKYALLSSNGEKAYAQTLDVESGQQGEKMELPFNYYRYNVQNGKYHDLYLTDEYGVYGYNFGDTEITKLMDYISSDFNGNRLYDTIFYDENTFFGSYYGETGMNFSRFTKVAAEDVKDKVELTLGCYYLDSKVKERLIDFNRNNDEYKITILDYSVYDTMDDYTQGLTKLNTDIVSGKVPDIMLLNQNMPVNSYISKGLFADLNTFIEKDQEFKKEDFLQNVFDALSTEDGLYQIAPSFMVSSFAAKTADVGEEPGWTMDEAIKILESKPEGTRLFSEMIPDTLLRYATWISIDDYVNWDTGECSFDSEGFIKILEFAATLPKEIDYSAVMDDESYWNEMEAQFRNGKTLVSMAYLSSFRDYQYMKQGTFGEDITLIGFPTDKGIGAGLGFSTNIAISAQGKNQETAWEFVKGFFTEEYQDSIEYEFPVRISSLDKLEERAWSRPYREDENGKKEEYDDYFYLNGVEVKLEPLTKEETAVVREYIQKVTNVAVTNEEIYNIILEETQSYFNGQKSAQEVAGIIQSRVKIYVNENR